MKNFRSSHGVSMVEVIVTVAIVAILSGVAAPNFSIWIKNTQIRNTAESVLSGLQVARIEALRRNTSIRFQLTTNLTASCALSQASANWVVSFDDPTNSCNASLFNEAFTAQDTTNNPAPRILKRSSVVEGVGSAQISTTQNTIVFNATGRVTPVPAAAIVLNVTNSAGGTCRPSGSMRCMNVIVTSGGQARMCDPSLANTDPRSCN